MIDFWMAMILTLLVSVLTIFADWLAYTIIVKSKTLGNLENIRNSGLTVSDAYDKVAAELERYSASRSGLIAWGADLAAVAISLDITGLGIWIHNQAIFPFFSRFNGENSSREIPVWLMVLVLHFLMLLISLTLKNYYGEMIARVPSEMQENARNKITQNAWMIGANCIGFFALLGSIVIFTNAL